MAVTVTAMSPVTGSPVDATQQQFVVDLFIALTGNYGGASSHGDTMSLAGFDFIKSNSLPLQVEIFEVPAAGTAATGYRFYYAPGTTLANGVLNIMNTTATEYTQGAAYNTALLNAVIRVRAWFPSFV